MENPVDTFPWADRPVWKAVDCGPGWFPILIVLDEKLKALSPDYKVVQIKEKFGTLRYYVEGLNADTWEKAQQIIREAEELSAVTCELCGQPGTLRTGGWMRTLCDPCEAARKSQREHQED